MIFGMIVLEINTHRIYDITSYFKDGSHDVISCRKVLPFGECTRSVCPAPAASAGWQLVILCTVPNP